MFHIGGMSMESLITISQLNGRLIKRYVAKNLFVFIYLFNYLFISISQDMKIYITVGINETISDHWIKSYWICKFRCQGNKRNSICCMLIPHIKKADRQTNVCIYKWMDENQWLLHYIFNAKRRKLLTVESKWV